jgi:hypothetical protein
MLLAIRGDIVLLRGLTLKGANPMPRIVPARLLRENYKIFIMSTDKKGTKKHDPASEAYEQAEKDILHDPELSDSDPTDDLDEGELARKDNSDEEALDNLEKPRVARGDHAAGGEHAAKGEHSGKGHHSGKGKEK